MAAAVNGSREHIQIWEDIPGLVSVKERPHSSSATVIDRIYSVDPTQLSQKNYHIFFPVDGPSSISKMLFVKVLEEKHFTPESGVESFFVMKVIELVQDVFICWIQFPAAEVKKCYTLAKERNMRCISEEIGYEFRGKSSAEPAIFFYVPKNPQVLSLASSQSGPSG